MNKPVKKPKISIVQDVPSDYGVYVWLTAQKKFYKDDHGNIMNIPARQFDFTAMSKIRQAARHYGVEEGGKPHFIAGSRRVSEMEYSEQKGRLAEGYIPSETDIGAWTDAKKGFLTHGTD